MFAERVSHRQGEVEGSGSAIGQGEMETYQTMVDIGRCTGKNVLLQYKGAFHSIIYDIKKS